MTTFRTKTDDPDFTISDSQPLGHDDLKSRQHFGFDGKYQFLQPSKLTLKENKIKFCKDSTDGRMFMLDRSN